MRELSDRLPRSLCYLVKSIEYAVEENVHYRAYRCHYDRRDADSVDPSDYPCAWYESFYREIYLPVEFGIEYDCKNKCNDLTDNRRYRRALDAESEGENKERIEQDVYYRTDTLSYHGKMSLSGRYHKSLHDDLTEKSEGEDIAD